MLNKAIVVGLTGPTGSGKGQAAAVFKKNGFEIIDADEIARRVVEPNSPLLRELSKTFGEDILNSDGSLNRVIMAQIAFTDKENQKLLNSIMHPAIMDIINEQANHFIKNGTSCVIDAPLLFEAGGENICDITVCIISPEKVRLERIIERDGISREKAKNRMNSQSSDEFYISKATYSIFNDSDLDSLISKTEFLIKTIREDLQ